MITVSVQIQRAISDAISNQVLPQIQNVIKAGSGQLTKKAWNVPSERPEANSEVPLNPGMRNNMRNEQDHDCQYDEQFSHIAHDKSKNINKIFFWFQKILVSVFQLREC